MPKKKAAVSKPTAHAKSKAGAGLPKPKLERLSSKVVFRGRIFQVTSDKVKEPSGVVGIREVVRHGGSVVVLAIEESAPEPRVLLERQYRYAAESYMLEIPAGSIDRGENALAAGKRELLEETGYTAKSWKPALFFYPSPGFLDETMTVFLARGLKPGNAQPEADEVIECLLVPLSDAVSAIMAGKIHDGKTIAAVLWAKEYFRRHRH
jgi:ADP-ribose pyrophosphatase